MSCNKTYLRLYFCALPPMTLVAIATRINILIYTCVYMSARTDLGKSQNQHNIKRISFYELQLLLLLKKRWFERDMRSRKLDDNVNTNWRKRTLENPNASICFINFNNSSNDKNSNKIISFFFIFIRITK